jgi:hypothetical protein
MKAGADGFAPALLFMAHLTLEMGISSLPFADMLLRWKVLAGCNV